jgi:hypothetical protein
MTNPDWDKEADDVGRLGRSIFPVFDINVPMPKTTKPPRAPYPTAPAKDASKRK